MNSYLKTYNQADIDQIVKKRNGETKLGECIQIGTNEASSIKNSDVKFVLFGITEDIGVQLNNGISGTNKAWQSFLPNFLNIQENQFNKGSDILLLGFLDFSSETNDENLITKIDNSVTETVKMIVSTGKKPIIIGGGHNNSYGNIKGTSLALGKKINAINFDAHTDFRALEGRHSGNGFSYAYSEGYLNKYFMFGIHENYTSEAIFNQISENKDLELITFEAIEIHEEIRFNNAVKKGIDFVENEKFGIEVDLDTVQNVQSSAMTPSSFSVNQTRKFIYLLAKNSNNTYLHICEAAPYRLESEVLAQQTGKLIAYLVSDYIKA